MLRKTIAAAVVSTAALGIGAPAALADSNPPPAPLVTISYPDLGVTVTITPNGSGPCGGGLCPDNVTATKDGFHASTGIVVPTPVIFVAARKAGGEQQEYISSGDNSGLPAVLNAIATVVQAVLSIVPV
jgi:hypothetical protein